MADAKSSIPVRVSLPSSRQNRKLWEHRLMVATVVIVLAAWVYGYFANGTDAAPLVSEVIPGAVQVDIENGLFVGRDEAGNVLGYATVGEAPGYGGRRRWPD